MFSVAKSLYNLIPRNAKSNNCESKSNDEDDEEWMSESEEEEEEINACKDNEEWTSEMKDDGEFFSEMGDDGDDELYEKNRDDTSVATAEPLMEDSVKAWYEVPVDAKYEKIKSRNLNIKVERVVENSSEKVFLKLQELVSINQNESESVKEFWVHLLAVSKSLKVVNENLLIQLFINGLRNNEVKEVVRSSLIEENCNGVSRRVTLNELVVICDQYENNLMIKEIMKKVINGRAKENEIDVGLNKNSQSYSQIQVREFETNQKIFNNNYSENRNNGGNNQNDGRIGSMSYSGGYDSLNDKYGDNKQFNQQQPQQQSSSQEVSQQESLNCIQINNDGNNNKVNNRNENPSITEMEESDEIMVKIASHICIYRKEMDNSKYVYRERKSVQSFATILEEIALEDELEESHSIVNTNPDQIYISNKNQIKYQQEQIGELMISKDNEYLNMKGEHFLYNGMADKLIFSKQVQARDSAIQQESNGDIKLKSAMRQCFKKMYKRVDTDCCLQELRERGKLNLYFKEHGWHFKWLEMVYEMLDMVQEHSKWYF